MAPITEARRRANEKWNAKAYDEIKIRVPKGQKQTLQAHAKEAGESLNQFILKAVERRMSGAHDEKKQATSKKEDGPKLEQTKLY